MNMAMAGGVYLGAHLAPFAAWLADETVSEIIVNQPGQVWLERSDSPAMIALAAPEISDQLIERLAQQIARQSAQAINRENPLLGATLPGGARVQVIAPPATRQHWALAIRRHKLVRSDLNAFLPEGRLARPGVPSWHSINPQTQPRAFLEAAMRERATILISGGTSSGKTTLLSSLLGLIEPHERIVLVEDTPEIALSHANSVGLVAVKGELGETRITTNDLLQASLRMRPDRLVLGELRGGEAVSFLRAINTGHPGSLSTIHANSPDGALEQLAMMTMQSGIGLGRAETIEYSRSVIDIVVQLDRSGGQRRISAISLTRC